MVSNPTNTGDFFCTHPTQIDFFGTFSLEAITAHIINNLATIIRLPNFQSDSNDNNFSTTTITTATSNFTTHIFSSFKTTTTTKISFSTVETTWDSVLEGIDTDVDAPKPGYTEKTATRGCEYVFSTTNLLEPNLSVNTGC